MSSRDETITHELATRVLEQCVGTSAIGDLFAQISGRRISAQAINLRTKRSGFPEPVLNDPGRARLWLRSEVEEHLQATESGGEDE